MIIGKLHKVPADLQKTLNSDRAALAKWEHITPLARNEWICWVLNAKQLETEIAGLKEYVQSLKRECAGLVAGLVAFIVPSEITPFGK